MEVNYIFADLFGRTIKCLSAKKNHNQRVFDVELSFRELGTVALAYNLFDRLNCSD